MLRAALAFAFVCLWACKPDGGPSAPEPTASREERRGPASSDEGKFTITFENRCDRTVTIYFAPLTDEYTPGEPPTGAQSLELEPGDKGDHTMDPGQGAWLVDEKVGTTARTAFGDGTRGWEGTVAIASGCRSFAE